jgi:hypothetical protein
MLENCIFRGGFLNRTAPKNINVSSGGFFNGTAPKN